MRSKRNSLFSEIQGVEAPRRTCLPALNFDALIARQQLLIQQLHHENKHLRQYALYFVGEPDYQPQLPADSPEATGDCGDDSEARRKKGGSLKEVVKEIMAMVEAKNVDEIVAKLRVLLERANRKIEPVFVERIKYKEVPVPMEVIKQVEKPVIVYRDRIVEVPVFREKIVERFVSKPADKDSTLSNKGHQSIGYAKQERPPLRAQNYEEEQSVEQPDYTKKKRNNFVEAPKFNQTLNIKSPKFREKDDSRDSNGWGDKSYVRSPKYKQK